jgi:hypothetical protein
MHGIQLGHTRTSIEIAVKNYLAPPLVLACMCAIQVCASGYYHEAKKSRTASAAAAASPAPDAIRHARFDVE